MPQLTVWLSRNYKIGFNLSNELHHHDCLHIDRSRELIRAGYHNEAVFWIIATFARCHKILAADASLELQHALAPEFKEMMADIGITSSQDLIISAEKSIQFLPSLWEVTEDILLKNPKIINK